MPIKGLSDRLRLVRRGKIRLGEKQISEKTGKEYPVALDYFACPEEVRKVYGDKPKKLDIMLPMENTENFFPQFYKRYGASKGLICKGDGETATRINGKGEMEEIPCLGQECPYVKNKECKAIGSLQVILPKVEGLGVYQIDTSSTNSIINLNSCIEMIRGMIGQISWIPLILEVNIQEAHPLVNGNRIKTKVPVMSITIPTTVPEMLKMREKNIKTSLPKPDKIVDKAVIENPKIDEKEELLYPDTEKEVKKIPIKEEIEQAKLEDTHPIGNGPNIPEEEHREREYDIGERAGVTVGEQLEKDKKKKLIQRIHIVAGDLKKAGIWQNESYVAFLEKQFSKHSSKDMTVKELELAVDLMKKIYETNK